MLVPFEIFLDASEGFVLFTAPSVSSVFHIDALVVTVLVAAKIRHVWVVLALKTAQIMRLILQVLVHFNLITLYSN